MLAAQIEERRAELAYLRTVWPQGLARSAGVAPESGARTDDGTLGGVGSRGVTRAPMADTDTAGAVECAVQAGASDAEGFGMDASDDFDVFETERRAELAFLRTVWPQGPTRSAGVAPESGARTDDGTLGGVGPQGVTRAPMAGTDTAGE